MKLLISKTYSYVNETPANIHPRQYFKPFQPLDSEGIYTPFLAYPKLILDSSIEKLQLIRDEETKVIEEQIKALNMKQSLEDKLFRESKIDEKEHICRGK